MAMHRPTYWPAAGEEEGGRAGCTVGQGCGKPRCGKQAAGGRMVQARSCRSGAPGHHARQLLEQCIMHELARAVLPCSHSLELGTHSRNRNISRVPWWNHIFMGGSALLLPAMK